MLCHLHYFEELCPFCFLHFTSLHTHTVFPHQCPPTTVHRSLSPTTNANIPTTLFTYLPLAPPPSVQNAKWAEAWWPAPPGTIFIVISRNSPGFIWKLERGSSWASSFQDADVTALARARSLIGVGHGRSEAGCAECDMCTAEREVYVLQTGFFRGINTGRQGSSKSLPDPR